MAETRTVKKATQKATKSATAKTSKGLSADEKAALKDYVRELKADNPDGEGALLAKLAEMSESDRAMGKRLHKIVRANAPALAPTTWYGMPAYAKNGKTVCFFQPAQKFKTRYSTFGFNDSANLDEGGMWPVAFALNQLTAAEEAKIGALVKKAAS